VFPVQLVRFIDFVIAFNQRPVTGRAERQRQAIERKEATSEKKAGELELVKRRKTSTGKQFLSAQRIRQLYDHVKMLVDPWFRWRLAAAPARACMNASSVSVMAVSDGA